MGFCKSSASSTTPQPKPHSHQSFSESLMVDSMEVVEAIVRKRISPDDDAEYSSVSSSSFRILSSLFSTSGGREETRRYVDAVSGLQSAMRRLISVNPRSEKLVQAKKLMCIAMKQFENEFYRSLKWNRRYLDPESVSVRSSRGSCQSTPKNLSRSVSECGSDHESEFSNPDEVKSGSEKGDEDTAAMADLKMIVDCMISSGYGKECLKIYTKIRKSVIVEALDRLGIEYLSLSQVQKLEWKILEKKIKKWQRTAKIAVTRLFYGERILSDYVFSSSASICESSFRGITRENALSLFAFPENVAKCRKSPEKIFCTLDVYEEISSLFPEIEQIFNYDSTSAVRSQAAESLAKLRESVRSMMAEFESSISKEPSKSPLPGGGVHHLARYVMNFMAFLADYSDSLAGILPETPLQLPDDYFGSGGEETAANAVGSPPVATNLAWLILILLCKIDTKSRLYKDVALSYLFLANNVNYIVVKVRSSNLKTLIGEDWVAKQEAKVRQYVAKYEKIAWGQALTSLPEDPTAEIPTEEIFRRFNKAFEEAYKRQSSWVVPDPQLRDEIKASVASKLVPAYSELYKKYRVGSCQNIRQEWIVRFAPEDLGNYLSDLFLGTGGSGSISSSSSDSSRFGR